MVDSINDLNSILANYRLREDDSKSEKELGQDEFLELLTTQLQNQNPLEPMENGDFLGQMAQFGTVNGITQLQETVQSLTQSLQSNQALQASTMVGRTVLINSATGVLESTGAELRGAIDLPSASGTVNLNISNAAGEVVRSLSLGAQQAGLVDFVWDGRDNGGNPVPAGSYSLSAEGSIDNDNYSLQPLVQARVDSVTLQQDGSSPTLNLGELGSILLDSVRQVM